VEPGFLRANAAEAISPLKTIVLDSEVGPSCPRGAATAILYGTCGRPGSQSAATHDLKRDSDTRARLGQSPPALTSVKTSRARRVVVTFPDAPAPMAENPATPSGFGSRIVPAG
jgi:hypothetical protein